MPLLKKFRKVPKIYGTSGFFFWYLINVHTTFTMLVKIYLWQMASCNVFSFVFCIIRFACSMWCTTFTHRLTTWKRLVTKTLFSLGFLYLLWYSLWSVTNGQQTHLSLLAPWAARPVSQCIMYTALVADRWLFIGRESVVDKTANYIRSVAEQRTEPSQYVTLVACGQSTALPS